MKIILSYAQKPEKGLNICCKFSVKSVYILILLLFCILIPVLSPATNYYVSNSGNDSNSGTSAELPWRTLEKVNNFFKLEPGDQILFKRGDQWNGEIIVRQSGLKGKPITYGAYGSGENPKIYGSETITGWTKHAGNIYKASVVKNVTQLFAGNKRLLIARYPKTGYFKITRVNNSTEFTSSEIQSKSSDFYKGAMLGVKSYLYQLNFKTVTGSSGQTLKINSRPEGELGADKGFFLTNKPEFLTEPGEWCYDSSSKTLYAWMPDGNSPENYEIRAAVLDKGITIDNNKRFITVRDIAFLHHSISGVYCDNSEDIIIEDNEISFCQGFGIYTKNNGERLFFSNNRINDVYTGGIRINYGDNNNISNNIINKVGRLESIGNFYPLTDSPGTAIASMHGNAIIEYNRITDSGYIGIYFNSGKCSIFRNFIDGALQELNDGGAIYSYGGYYDKPQIAGSVIKENLILNVLGNSDGTNSKYKIAFGVYLDNKIHSVTMDGNLIANSSGGFNLNGGGKNIVKNNTLFGCLVDINSAGQVEPNTITGNIMYKTNGNGILPILRETNQLFVYELGNANNNFDYNNYFTPYNKEKLFIDYKNFQDWQKAGKDIHSTYNDTPHIKNQTEYILYNDSKQVTVYNTGNKEYKNIFGEKISGEFKLEPFTSLILIGDDFSNLKGNPLIESSSFNVVSPVEIGQKIGKVNINEAESYGNIFFSILNDKDSESGLFYIDPASGDIYSGSYIQTPDDLSYILLIKAADESNTFLSDSAYFTINIIGNSIAPPAITSFKIPPTAYDLSVPVLELGANDNGVNFSYFISENPVAPKADDEGWLHYAPESYIFSGEGTYTLYAWVKDDAGNISNSFSQKVTIILSDYSPQFSEYLFEELNGNIVFDSANSNDGTLSGTYTRTEGAKGNGIEFSGSGYINLGECFCDNVRDEITLSVWLKPDSNGNGYQGIIMHGGPDTDTYALYINPETKTIGFKTNGTIYAWITADNADELWDGGWHHLAAVYDGAEKKIYLDNNPIAVISATGAIDSGIEYNLLIGAGRDNSQPELLYSGVMDEVRIYNYALSPDEIGELFHSVNRELHKIFTEKYITICERDDYNGWTDPGEYEQIFHRLSPFASGADSIVITHLSVSSVVITEDINISEDDSYNGWTEAGTYSRILISSQGCDSTVVTNLTVGEEKVHLIELSKGWNIFSSYLFSNENTVKKIMNTLSNNGSLVRVVDERENTFEEAVSGEWVDNIGTVQKAKGYKVLTNSSETLEIKGWKVSLPLETELFAGKNLVSFPYDFEIDAMQIINPLIETGLLEKVQDEKGNSIEYWNSIGWINSVGNFKPGKGYILHVSDNCLFTFYEHNKKSTSVYVSDSTTEFFKVSFEGNGFAHMNINILGLAESGLEPGDEIALFDNSICTGAIKLSENNFITGVASIPVSSADDKGNPGFIQGNKAELTVWRKQKNEILKPEPVLVHGDMIFQKYSSTFIYLNISDSDAEMNIYPNPAKDVVYLSFSTIPAEGIIISFMDSSGKEILKRYSKSNSEIINVRKLRAGVYYVKVMIGSKPLTKKVIIT